MVLMSSECEFWRDWRHGNKHATCVAPKLQDTVSVVARTRIGHVVVSLLCLCSTSSSLNSASVSC